MTPAPTSWRDQPRESVHVVESGSLTGSDRSVSYLCGIETCEREHANIFATLHKDEDGEYDALWGPADFYYPAQSGDAIDTEVEVRFAFATVDDVEDHAEVYLWQVYHWKIQNGEARCSRDEHWGGEYVVESFEHVGAVAPFQPVVAAAIERIRNVRWNGVEFPPRTL